MNRFAPDRSPKTNKPITKLLIVNDSSGALQFIERKCIEERDTLDRGKRDNERTVYQKISRSFPGKFKTISKNGGRYFST